MKNVGSCPFLHIGMVVLSVLALAGLPRQAVAGEKNEQKFEFDLVRSPALNTSPNCVPDAEGDATIQQKGPVEILKVEVKGLPPNTDFDFFVIQQPNGPFGMSWYQGDIDTDDEGTGHGKPRRLAQTRTNAAIFDGFGERRANAGLAAGGDWI